VRRSRDDASAGTSAARNQEKNSPEPGLSRKTGDSAGWYGRRKLRRVPAAGAAVLLALALAGLGATAAQAVTDTFKVVFQANNNLLAGYSSSGSNFTSTAGMMAGTSPSVALLTDGTYEAAFEANNDDLALSHLGGGNAATTLGMDNGTSPAIAALPGGGWVTAFQDNANKLYLYDSHGDKINTNLGMDPGTSPSLAVQPDGTYRVVFQANNNLLAGYNSSGSNYTTTVGMHAGTSPAIAAQPGGTYEIAVEANTSDLATIHLGTGYTVNTTTLGMDTGTSPSIAVQPDATFKVVFQDNDNVLAGYNSSGSSYTTTAGMKPGTSPTITPEPDGTYEIAIEANTSALATIHLGTGYTINTTTLGMDTGTSPSLANPPPTSTGTVGAKIVSFAEGQVGYQDNPSGTFCNAFSAYWNSGSSCGNGNLSEEWCADFDAWAWRMAGVSFTYAYVTGDINGGAASFYQWGVANGTWHAAGSGYTPQPGDVVVYGLNSAGTSADHSAIVTSFTSGDAGPNVVNGDWWSSGNGAVVAATDQTTATGTDGISGYVSP
jgi:hypothetical protein